MRLVLTAIGFGAACVVPAAASAAEWRIMFITVSGNVTTCTASYGDKYLVVEENSTLTVNSLNKRVRHMTVPLGPDGSAEGEFMLQLGGTHPQPVRVKVPAGSGARRFEYLNLRNVCGIRADPL